MADEYPQPLVTELIDRLKNAKFYSKMDLLSGFHQVRMASEDQDKTAFRSPFGTFSYKVMPLGLKNASKTFQRMVEYVLRDYIGKSIIVFIEDILVYSNTKEEHEKLLREVLKTLQDNEFKTKKCEFFRVLGACHLSQQGRNGSEENTNHKRLGIVRNQKRCTAIFGFCKFLQKIHNFFC